MLDLRTIHERARLALRQLSSLGERGLTRLALRGVDQVGLRPRVHGLPFIENLGRITVGDELTLFASPVRSHLVTGPRGSILIGDGVTLESGVGIAAEAEVRIGSGAHLGPFVLILDTDYHAVDDREAPGVAEPIVIGDDAWLGRGVTVLRGARIGRGARIEPGSVVSGNIPDGAHAAGVPARVLVAAVAPAPRAPEGGQAPDLATRVQRVAREVFALPETPAGSDGPAQIHAWDSLGALRLLVSVEEELGVSLPQDTLAGVHDLAGLCDVAARRLAERAATHAHGGPG
jgi:maltose O-acetyltransferase